MIRPRSLQQRLVIFMLLPVAVLLFSMGFVGFIYARKSLLSQWEEATMLKLQRAAHFVDMRLSRPKELLEFYNKAADKPYAAYIKESVVEQLDALEGVVRVRLTWVDGQSDRAIHRGRDHHRGTRSQWPSTGPRRGMMRFHTAGIAKVRLPRYDPLIENRTVSLISDLEDESGREIGRLEVVLRFDYLTDAIVPSDWWQSHKAFLVDSEGRILTSTNPETRQKLGDNNDPLELATLKAIKEKQFGTIRRRGYPPAEVSGFYRLQQAPWYFVLVAPGREILSPIVRFRFYYFITGSIFILIVLFLIRLVAGRTVSSIKDVSLAADKIAKGRYGAPLPVKTQDEVGELVRSFNTMVFQLEERMRLKQALDLAMEVQQNLLPRTDPKIEGLDIAGKSIYCDETGGDYYDFLDRDEHGQRKIGVLVGDVSEHGIPSALLMTTARAFLRQRSSMSGSITNIVSDVNRQLSHDVEETGRFMTLFYGEIDTQNKCLRWVNAGHDPGIIYDSSSDSFEELGGGDLPLGVFEDSQYTESNREIMPGQIIVIGTDGVWEARNPKGEMFGKNRLRQIIRAHSTERAKQIVDAVIKESERFRNPLSIGDDFTLVVVKVVRTRGPGLHS